LRELDLRVKWGTIKKRNYGMVKNGFHSFTIREYILCLIT
jgi:hypothetical protein